MPEPDAPPLPSVPPTPSVPPALLRAFPPALDGLLDRARAHVSTPVLMDLSQADYGLQADEHLAALKRIRETGAVPAPIDLVPQVVLNLARWCNPDVEETAAGAQRVHWMRAFACAALLRAGAEPANRGTIWSRNPTLAQMTASAVALGPEWVDALGGFLTARLALPGTADERPFLAFALLFLAVIARGGPLDDAALVAAVDWAIDEEAAAVAYEFEYAPPRGPWLFRLDRAEPPDGVWRSFAQRMRDEAPALSPPARDAVLLLTDAMLDG